MISQRTMERRVTLSRCLSKSMSSSYLAYYWSYSTDLVMATDIIAQRQMSCLAGLANMALTTEESKSGFEPLSKLCSGEERLALASRPESIRRYRRMYCKDCSSTLGTLAAPLGYVSH